MKGGHEGGEVVAVAEGGDLGRAGGAECGEDGAEALGRQVLAVPRLAEQGGEGGSEGSDR